MARTHALMASVSANLNDFLEQIIADLIRSRKKFVRDRSSGQLVNGYWPVELYAKGQYKDVIRGQRHNLFAIPRTEHPPRPKV